MVSGTSHDRWRPRMNASTTMSRSAATDSTVSGAM
jgi:hypothetical protein